MVQYRYVLQPFVKLAEVEVINLRQLKCRTLISFLLLAVIVGLIGTSNEGISRAEYSVSDQICPVAVNQSAERRILELAKEYSRDPLLCSYKKVFVFKDNLLKLNTITAIRNLYKGASYGTSHLMISCLNTFGWKYDPSKASSNRPNAPVHEHIS